MRRMTEVFPDDDQEEWDFLRCRSFGRGRDGDRGLGLGPACEPCVCR